MEVNAYKANTLATQANSPKVNKFKGNNKIFRRGTSMIFIIIKTAAPISKLLTPPLYVKPGIKLVVRKSATKFIKKWRRIVFIDLIPFYVFA